MTNNAKNYYYAITIGPVVDTILMSSKPLGLWFSSYIFSEFSRRICTSIANDIKGEIILPHFDKNKHGKIFTAVGMFPDRIIFKSDKEYVAIKDAIDEVRSDFVSVVFTDSTLKDYFYFHLLQLNLSDGDSIIESFSGPLDSMELNRPFMAGQLVEKMKKLVTDSENVKKTTLFNNIYLSELNLLRKETKETYEIRDLGEICKNFDEKKRFKSQKYYALIQADGDRVGELLKILSKGSGNLSYLEKGIKDFSNKIFEYASSLPVILKKYGGSLIYAGGDDLLALVPVYQKNGQSLLALCDEINAAFKKKLEVDSVSISFGISIFYYKYPLYEAFKQVQYQLFGVAKDKKYKDCIALTVQKHSGQTMNLIIKNKTGQADNLVDKLYELISTGKIGSSTGSSSGEVSENNSIMYHLMNNKFFFIFAMKQAIQEKKPQIIKNAFNNYFDHVTQKEEGHIREKVNYVQTLVETLMEMANAFNTTMSEEEINKVVDDVFEKVINILRYRKFLTEKGDD